MFLSPQRSFFFRWQKGFQFDFIFVKTQTNNEKEREKN